ncbi:DUF5806 family protein [Halorhabdus rudnickae]|uniref:DUF5806 family protein n=1 Tax=Halorhabdus rudnickae TaxID=1775544 RepID=UPI001FCE92E7|nr:DUF5806 family protein [Halorhabdus rudnickae]
MVDDPADDSGPAVETPRTVEGTDDDATDGSTSDGSPSEGPPTDAPAGDDTPATASEGGNRTSDEPADDHSGSEPPADVRSYDRFQKIDGGTYDRANDFLRERTYITAREWAIARLCADFRTETGVEMTKIGENLPDLVPFMTDTYSPQAVNQARASFEEKVQMAGATFLYGAMSDFFTADELDDLMYEATEVAKFLLEVEGVELSVDEELEAEDRISEVMREVREHSVALRHDEVECPECGHSFHVDSGE